MKFRIYRYDPEKDAKPYYQDYDVELDPHDRMLLDALIAAEGGRRLAVLQAQLPRGHLRLGMR
jgi:succinate dehydrogenase/fumarate reductase-like Fe-S protein